MSLDQHPTSPGPEATAPPPPAPVSDGAMTAGQWARLAGVLALLVWLTAATGIYGLAMVLGIVIMIALHELGHFVMAKRAGMKCTEFFLGFGPRIWSVQRGETEYGLKLIPAGAYVKIIGMHDLEDVDPADEPLTYRQKPFWQRFGVAVAGSTVHFILALALIYTLLVGFGLPGGSLNPSEDEWRVSEATSGSAAEAAGLVEGDDIVAVDGQPIATFDDLKDAVVDRADETVALTVVAEDGTRRDVDATLGENPRVTGAGFLGVRGDVPLETLGPVEAVPATFVQFGEVTVESVKALGRLFTPSGIADFGGQVADAGDDAPAQVDDAPSTANQTSAESSANEGENRLLSLLGVFRIGVDASEGGGGWAALVLLFALINVFIGMFNLVPLLPFDGGHVAIAIYEKVQEKRKHLSHRYLADVTKLLPLTYAVVAILAVIFISTLYLDIRNPLNI
ncbi:MAG: M50 family metallopeptidase [Iamia sp.]